LNRLAKEEKEVRFGRTLVDHLMEKGDMNFDQAMEVAAIQRYLMENIDSEESVDPSCIAVDLCYAPLGEDLGPMYTPMQVGVKKSMPSRRNSKEWQNYIQSDLSERY
jgi:hypothetical protein